MAIETVSHYEIIDKLSDGGMGVVYRARDTRLDRVVALKFLLPQFSYSDVAERRFIMEAKAAAALDHPNICTVHEIGEAGDGRLFISMPLYDGESLKAKLTRGPLEAPQAIDYTRQVCHGLAKAHERGIVHRDIKPANVLVTDDGLVKIVDFGIAKLADVTMTATGGVIGTVSYMSPEQADGAKVDHRSDIFSVGVMLYEMLSGTLPFDGPSIPVIMNAILSEEPASLGSHCPSLPDRLVAATHKALAKDVDARYQSIQQLATELDQFDRSITRGTDAGTAIAGQHRAAELRPEGERRQATIVVCYLAGYDDMVESLAPDQVDYVAERCEGAAGEIVTRHGGVVNRYSGDELVAVFGIPTTHEDDTVRAARAALELRDQIREMEFSRDLGLAGSIDLQVGISSGSVVAQASTSGDQQYRMVGDALHVAGRAAEEADVGEVLVSAESRRLLAPFFATEEGTELKLKGGAQSATFRLLGESGLQTRLEAAEVTGLTAYTGRKGERDTLQSRAEQALRGDGQFVSIIGDAGLGKSRLLFEFSKSITQQPVTILRGRCQSYAGNSAYLPFLNMLRESLGLPSGDLRATDLEDALSRLRGIDEGLVEFFPLYLHLLTISTEQFSPPKHLKGEDLRVAIMEALSALLTLRTTQQPVVLLLEDWHWVDDASADALAQLAALVPSYPMLVVVTHRPDYAADFGSGPNYTRINLTPLDLGAALEIIKSVLDVDTVPDEFAELIHSRTGGNPFFLEEISEALREDGTIEIKDRGIVLAGSLEKHQLPDTVQAVIRSRLDRMDGDARDVLCYASVIGREFTRDILQCIRPDDTTLLQSVETLKGLGLIQQTRILPHVSYRFKHALTQDVTYESLLHHQRKDLHGRVGEAIEQIHADQLDEQYDLLARHFTRAEHWHKAVDYGMNSSSRAWQLSQFQESLSILENTESCLMKLPDDTDRRRTLTRLLLRKERLFELMGLRRRQLQIIDRLIVLPEVLADPAQLSEVYIRLGDVHILLRNHDAAEEALHKALDLCRQLGDAAQERKTLRSIGLLRWHQGRNQESLQVMERVLAADRKNNDLAAVIGDISNITAVLKDLGDYKRGKTYLNEAIQIAETIESTSKVAYLEHILGTVYRMMGETKSALEHHRRAAAVSESNRLWVQHGFNLSSVANIEWQQGNTEEAIQTYERAVRMLRRTRHAEGLSHSLRTLADILVGLQRHGEALPHLREAAELCATMEDRQTEAQLWLSIGEVHEQAGDYPEAMTAWGKGRTLAQQAEDTAIELEILQQMALFTRNQVPEPSLALQYYREALAVARSANDAAKEGDLCNTMGIMEWERGNFSDALQHYERALALLQDQEETADAGLVLTSIGVTLHKLGRMDEATERLSQAVQHNRTVGARQLEGFALAALGDVQSDQGGLEDAIASYSQSLDIRRDIGDLRGEGWMQHNLARTYASVGTLDRKRDCATEAWRIAEACDDEELIEALRHLKD
jgi:tetratricopeptide (TPR) repeat protein/class 3 adenylate cyclase